MTIAQPLTKEQKQQLSEFLDSDQVAPGCLDFIAMHGFITGISTGPESLISSDWLEFLFDGTPDYHSKKQQSTIEAFIQQQALLIQRALYLGDDLELPCSVVASTEGETNPLSDWCFGFMEAIAVNEDLWFADPDLIEAIAELILPVGILSNQFNEPELKHLIKDNDARQQMANSLIENIQNLYLLFRE
ncbi:MAG: hypothetical protein DRQ47_09060 [Gammaproteobacteria bacterium]|nr:MAG: hypothetical protein DRQ47_09060 [Gammaproteobacteria bacterium]